jgi:hypothetical protein
MKMDVRYSIKFQIYSKLCICQVEVFWIVTQHNVVVGYQHFRGPCCLHLEGKVNGAGEMGIDIGLEYKRGQSLAANRKQEGAAWQQIGNLKG